MVTVTGSDDIWLADHAGVAVTGPPNAGATDAGETIQFSFNGGAAINVSYYNNNVGGFPGSGVGYGAAIVEGFDVGGTSLGTFVGCSFGTIDVSTPFGNVPLSRFTATAIVPVNGEGSFFRTGRLTYTPVDPILPVVIDIKPGSDPNSINLCSHGSVPVAILGTDNYDVLDAVTGVDPDTITLADANVRTVGKGNKLMCHEDDVNSDGLWDLVCQIPTVDLAVELGATDTTADLNGQAYDGTSVAGSDTIRIVKDCD